MYPCRENYWIHTFPKCYVKCNVLSRIWTRVAVSISCDDNHYTTGTSFSTVAVCAWKSSKKTTGTLQKKKRKLCFSLITQGQITEEKMDLDWFVFRRPPYSPDLAPSFTFSQTCSEWHKIFFRSGDIFCGKFLQVEINWIYWKELARYLKLVKGD